ncbi:MAG: methyltransferase [Bacteroidota bacterium]|jgi:tRNA G18 (ribose-2'-O)-methylase SpoU|nr:methyltransferase [Bacteroidota bacterium]
MNEKLSMQDLGRLSSDEFKAINKNKIILVLDNVRSLNNVGSAFRTADAFLIEEIYICGVTGIPPKPEIEKTALGATATVFWKYFKTTQLALEELKLNNYFIASVEQAKNSIKLNQFQKPLQPIALVFGNEVYGVEQEIINQSDVCLEIPQFGTKHSFNVSVSMGIVLWELLR